MLKNRKTILTNLQGKICVPKARIIDDIMILLIGKSGSGKTTVATELEKSGRGFRSVCSYTTRPPRFQGESGHIFVTDNDYDKLTDIVAYSTFDGYRYCATAKQFEENQIYTVDLHGLQQIKNNYKGRKHIVSVYLDVADQSLFQRMLRRGDSSGAAAQRIEHDKLAFADAASLCDYVIDANQPVREVLNDVLKIADSYVPEPMIYISHPSGGKRRNRKRLEQILELCMKFQPKLNYFSPVHNFGWAYHRLPYTAGLNLCVNLLPYASEMWVFGDYTHSTGCMTEIKICEEQNIPIRYMEESDENNFV